MRELEQIPLQLDPSDATGNRSCSACKASHHGMGLADDGGVRHEVHAARREEVHGGDAAHGTPVRVVAGGRQPHVAERDLPCRGEPQAVGEVDVQLEGEALLGQLQKGDNNATLRPRRRERMGPCRGRCRRAWIGAGFHGAGGGGPPAGEPSLA